MRRVVQYMAEDGTPFTDPDECAEYDREQKFTNELIVFLTNNFNSSSVDELKDMDKLWTAIYSSPDKFQKVLTAAKPKPKRGRPRKNIPKAKPTKPTQFNPPSAIHVDKRKALIEEALTRPTKTNQEKVANIRNIMAANMANDTLEESAEIKEVKNSGPTKRKKVLNNKSTNIKEGWRGEEF